MLIQEILNLKLIERFPELRNKYKEEVSWQEMDETGSHVVYGDVFTPFIEEKIEEKNEKKMVCICNFIEEILELDNEYAENVICLSVLEEILDDNKKIDYFKRFAKEKTISYIEKMIGK